MGIIWHGSKQLALEYVPASRDNLCMNTTALKKTVDELTNLIINFPFELREKKLFYDWTLREVVAHIAGWNLQRIGEIEAFLQGKKIEKILDFDAFNKQVIHQKRYYSWEALIDELKHSSSDLVLSFDSIVEDLANKKIWVDANSTPTTWLQLDIEHLRNEHISKLKTVLR